MREEKIHWIFILINIVILSTAILSGLLSHHWIYAIAWIILGCFGLIVNIFNFSSSTQRYCNLIWMIGLSALFIVCAITLLTIDHCWLLGICSMIAGIVSILFTIMAQTIASALRKRLSNR